MTKSIILLYVLALFNFCLAQVSKVSISDIYKENKFRTRSVYGMTFLKDGNYTKLDYNGMAIQINKYSIKTGKKLKTLFDNTIHLTDSNQMLIVEGYRYNEDESVILIETAREKVYRHSYYADNYLFEVKSKKLVALSNTGKQMYATISPKGDKVAFVRSNNIVVRDIKNGTESEITHDGSFNKIINGAGDWVYEEEFVLTRAFEWSPDGNKIAYVKFDESKVKEYDMTMYHGLYPKAYSFKYPKAGQDNSNVSVHVFDLNTKVTTDITLSDSMEYVPRIGWENVTGQLYIISMNRHQNYQKMVYHDMNTGEHTLILEERNPYYLEVQDELTFLDNGSFIWASEKDGYKHLYLHNSDGTIKKQLTKGKFDVTAFYGYDEKKRLLYFASSEISPTDRYVYSINLESGVKKQLTSETGTNTALFNKNFTYFINYHSSLKNPTEVALHYASGKQVRILEQNEKLNKQIAEYGNLNYDLIQIPANGVSLNAKIMRPKNFDSTKTYPVFMYVYGGPGSQTVNNSWGYNDFFWYSHLTELGYIVVSVDNRGTGARGQEFKKCTYMQLGKKESDDQIAAAQYLAELPYVDATRIGIFGWSYGGYMSSLCLFKGADVFKMAIAVAPVTNWKFYDSIYTERYMRTPAENKDGYTKNDPLYYADSLKGKYLLIHGTGDDNVHFQNAVELTERLIQSGKQFETMYYPNKAHGIRGGNSRFHLYTLMTNFIKENL